ncbi:DDE-type integrase/transposase/recombinase, partial [Aeribacillus composti]|nr:DDE-type integrase/transposase/recombinase [Aeribacillus composti]
LFSLTSNTLPFFFWSSKMLYTNFYTSSKRKQPVKVKKATSAGYIYENLLKRDFSMTRLNEKWVADVTKIAVDDEKLFVSAIMDVHNNGIVGYQISQTHDVQLVEDSLFYALEIRKIEDSLILHTDQGMPY